MDLSIQENVESDNSIFGGALNSPVDPPEKEEEVSSFLTQITDTPSITTSSEILISVEEARTRLGNEVLETFDEYFNGKLTEVRGIDVKDHIF